MLYYGFLLCLSIFSTLVAIFIKCPLVIPIVYFGGLTLYFMLKDIFEK
jgi:hypothetical protein